MTRRKKLKEIDNNLQAIKHVIKENNLKIPGVIAVFINRIDEIINPVRNRTENPFHIH